MLFQNKPNDWLHRLYIAFDDESSGIKEHEIKALRLRLLDDALTTTIESWQNFAELEIQYFDLTRESPRRSVWTRYVASIEESMSELKHFRRSLEQKIAMHDVTLNNNRQGVRQHNNGPRVNLTDSLKIRKWRSQL